VSLLSRIQAPYVIPYGTFCGRLITERVDRHFGNRYSRQGAGMGNAEEFSGQRLDLTRVMPGYRRSVSGFGRIRYAHSGVLPRAEPFCTVPQGTTVPHRTTGRHGTTGRRELTEHHEDDGHTRGIMGGGYGGAGAWPTEFPDDGRRSDLWVLVCGGIAAVAAFTAAFAASGGLASHPATMQGATRPAVVSHACSSLAP
jgi:hypothetical protein